MSKRTTRTADSTPVKSRREVLPDLSGITYADISRGTGISPSMLSRLFSDDPGQKRVNPTLRTLIVLRDYLEKRTGAKISLDTLVDAIT